MEARSPRTLLIQGGSRGIGAAAARHFEAKGDRVLAVSRSEVEAGEWIQADISTREGIEVVQEAVGDQALDGFFFLGGTWEDGAFTDAYDFQKSSYAETQNVLAVNLIAPIELTRALAPNLSRARNPRAVYMGSLSGLDQWGSREVANTASKFGLRGAVQALRLAMKDCGIGFTVVNPGNVSTEEVLEDIEEGRFPEQVPIPMADLLSALDWILSLSSAVELGDLDLMQREG